MYFVGVTTGSSAINRVFPRWASRLGLGDCELRGIDFPLHAPPAAYREAVEFLRHEPLALGALVTTHKIDLLTACRHLFDELDPLADTMGEVSSIYKRGGRLCGRAVDPWTAGASLQAFLPEDHWARTRAEALILGAGGSSIALSWHLCRPSPAGGPARLHVANRSRGRLDHLRSLHQHWGSEVPLHLHEVPQPGMADALCSSLPAGSLVVNATGLGKDAPGSPLTAAAVFPLAGFVWEFNYRGDLLFLQQAREQQALRRLHLEDGWRYFVLGWSQVISDVFDVPVPASGPVFEDLSRLAAEARQP